MEFGQMFDRENQSNVVRSPREGRQLRASFFFSDSKIQLGDPQ
jgi:hypothetical protein